MSPRAPADLRLFVAAYPSEASARAMLRAVSKIELPPHRLTPPSQIHLTLQFIGDVPARDLDTVEESIERSCAGVPPFTLTPQRLVALPLDAPRVRLVAATADAPPPMLELIDRLARRLARDPRARPREGYLAHLTLLRFRAPRRLEPLNRALDAPPFQVDRVILVRSVLKPAGAEHQPLREWTLPA